MNDAKLLRSHRPNARKRHRLENRKTFVFSNAMQVAGSTPRHGEWRSGQLRPWGSRHRRNLGWKSLSLRSRVLATIRRFAGCGLPSDATHSGARMDVSGRSFPFIRREVVLALGLVALTLAVYGRVYRFEFVDYDDPSYVISNPDVLSGLNVGSVRWAFGEVHAANWIPLTWLSLMLDATCYGSWPGGYHITNALLHLANVLLVFAIFARATGNPRSSALVAALFAVHPPACRIRRLDCRAQGRLKHVLWLAVAVRLCALRTA